MLVIPAIDLKAGRCVRLYQGDMNRATVYSDDPVATALRWQREGAERLHVVDLDGAVAGVGVNTGVIEQICRALAIPVQVGGGVRDLETVEKLLSRGVARVILGTVAYRRPEVVAAACERFPGHITVGIDARAGKVAVQGWTKEEAVREMTQGGYGFHEIWPNLPEWIKDMQISGLHVGEASVDLYLERHGSDVGVNVDRREGDVEVVVVK